MLKIEKTSRNAKGRKRVYHITPEGKEVIKIIEERIDMTRTLFWNLVSVNRNQEQTLVA